VTVAGASQHKEQSPSNMFAKRSFSSFFILGNIILFSGASTA